MIKTTLAALAVVIVAQSWLPAMAADRGRAVSCPEQCSKRPCQASSAECARARRACTDACR